MKRYRAMVLAAALGILLAVGGCMSSDLQSGGNRKNQESNAPAQEDTQKSSEPKTERATKEPPADLPEEESTPDLPEEGNGPDLEEIGEEDVIDIEE